MATERHVLNRPMHTARKTQPLHPPFTHFPIALWTLAFAFDILSIWVGNPMVRAAFYNIAAGTAFAVLAAAAGMLDYNKIPAGDPAKRTGVIHALLNGAAFVIFAISTWLHAGARAEETAPLINVVLTAVGLGAVVISGYLGHKMVFDYGANVVRLADEHLERAPDRARDIGRTPIRPQL